MSTVPKRHFRLIILLGLISLVCAVLQTEPAATWSAWHQVDILQGQWWRIVTGNFTHTNLAHLVMNLAGLWVICYLFRPRPFDLILALFLCSLGVGLLNLTTTMQGYVGLSGVLHGLFGYFALREYLPSKSHLPRRKSSGLLVLGLLAKIAWEQSMGAPESTSALIEAPVAIDAHLFGAGTGLLLALVMHLLTQQNKDAITLK